MVPVPLAYQPPFQYPAPVQYAAAPPPPPIPQYVQPAYQPEIRSQRWSDPSSSCKTVKDVETFMYNKKMKDIPQFRPNSYGQMAIYCDDRTDHEFVMKCITHRREIEPQLPALDLKRDSEKNHFFLQAMKDTLAQPIQELSAVTKSQTDFLETQNKALQALLQNQHQPQMLENSYFSAGNPEHTLVPSKLQTPSTAEELPPVNEKAPTQDRMEILNKFLATIPSQKEDKDSDLNLVTQQELDALKTTFSLPDGHVNIDLLKQTCKNNGVKYPAKLAKNFSAPQVRDLLYKLAVSVQDNKRDSDDSRYLYCPIFRFKNESIVTTFLNSHTLYWKPNPHVHREGLHSKVRYFDLICKNLDTRPVFLKHLINQISRAFYVRENKKSKSFTEYNVYDAQFFARVLCMLAHQLIRNRLLSQLNTLFDLTSNLFCDIVLFTTLCNQNKQKFLQNTKISS